MSYALGKTVNRGRQGRRRSQRPTTHMNLSASHEPQRRWNESIAQLARLAREHRVELIAIGNGTASRETNRLGAELIRLHPELS
jgi:transcriptional accessory protein Tex/SPT6